MRNYHQRSGSNFGRSRFGNRRSFGSRGGGRGSRYNPNAITVDKLIAKAVESEPFNIYVDDFNYSQFELTPVLQKNIYNKGYSNPTKIQFQTIPHILEGKDILGLASTDSGKTAAFLIPMVNKILSSRDETCLIMVPTRELATQIQDELRQLTANTGVRNVLIIGGSSMETQIRILQKSPEFIIATPGRLKDLAERGVINLSIINNVVLDEVDRMLDMGFIDDIRFIIQKINRQRQSLFFSATMDRKSEEIANTLLKSPIKIQTESQAPGKNVDQDVIKLAPHQTKFDVLLGLLQKEEFHKVLVFTATKREADNLYRKLRNNEIYVEALHGDKRQSQRNRIIDAFKHGKIDVLIATDVASRGLDVNNITHVINYDMPQTYEDYIHRIGRTGRAGKKGFAITFV